MITIADYVKDPNEVLDYSIDWSAWLPSGDSIASASWSAVGVSVATSPAPSVASGIATAWISGGTADTPATVTCQITTTSGRVGERSIRINVRDR